MSDDEDQPPEAQVRDEGNPEPARTEPGADEAEGATPPGYDDWPTNGGYLGCLMGLILGCVVAGFLGANLFSFIYIASNQSTLVFVLINIVLFAVVAGVLGRLGWLLGKRFYRYYRQPEPTWGEDDAAPSRSAFAPAKGEPDDVEQVTPEGAAAAEAGHGDLEPPHAQAEPLSAQPLSAQTRVETTSGGEPVSADEPVAPFEPILSPQDEQLR